MAQRFWLVPVLLKALEQAGIKVQAVTLSRPSLDDVYLHHTGHHFAANGTAALESNMTDNKA
jgi:ABC-2 type transport system ATP-binding protein